MWRRKQYLSCFSGRPGAVSRVSRALLVVAAISTIATGFRAENRPTPYRFPKLLFFPAMPASVANPVTVEGAELGRWLFYDSSLSADYRFSCGSCHRQAAAFSDGPVAFSRGVDGAELHRNTLPLFNLAWYQTLFWDGRAVSLEEQVFHPVRDHSEMNLAWPVAEARLRYNKFYRQKFAAAFGPDAPIDSVHIARAIAQFERTILSYNSRYDSVLRGEAYLTPDETDGFEAMNDMTKGGCLHCHTTDADALGTLQGFANNGLDAAARPADYRDAGRGALTGRTTDSGAFKIPTLRNIGLTAPYMHDGRFATLEDVMRFYNTGVHAGAGVDARMEEAHRGGVHLSAEETRKVIVFLRTLTDSVLVKAPALGNPFRP